MTTPEDEILLHEVLIKIQAIARRSYAGRDVENITFIFSKLTADEKRIFLEKAIKLFLIIDEDFERRVSVCELPHLDPTKDAASVKKEREKTPAPPPGPIDSNAIPLDEYNERLLLKLKNKLALAGGIGAMVFLALIALLVIFLGYGSEIGGFVAALRAKVDLMLNYDKP